MPSLLRLPLERSTAPARPRRRSGALRALPLGLALLALAASTLAAGPAAAQEGSFADVTLLLSANDGLRAQGMDYSIQQIDFLGTDGARASVRMSRQEFRWVTGDPRRWTGGKELSYAVDPTWKPLERVPGEALDKAVEAAVTTWEKDSCMNRSALRRVSTGGADVTVFDFLVAAGGFGDPFLADIVVAGFPEGLGEIFGEGVIAFSVTFIFVDGQGTPTDIDGDGFLDTALNEIYLNREVEWAAEGYLSADGADDRVVDLETVVLHELGHSLGLGHLGAPPTAVMNPTYGGAQTELQALDHAALCMVRQTR